MKSILLVKKFLGLVEMTSGLVNASFSLPEWQAVKRFSLHPAMVAKFLDDNKREFLQWRRRTAKKQ